MAQLRSRRSSWSRTTRLPKGPGRIFDYFHINSIEIDHDGNLLVSARNTHTIYKISRRTGKVLWRLGGKRSDFTLGRGVRFAWQHDARRRPDGALTLFDNSAGPQVRKQSRGLVLRLDLKRMHAARRPDASCIGRRSSRSTRRTCSGFPEATTSSAGATSRASPSSDREGRCSSTAASDEGGWTPTARIAFLGRRGRPCDEAFAVAVRSRNVYVSWNGATEVSSWQLLQGPRKTELAAGPNGRRKPASRRGSHSRHRRGLDRSAGARPARAGSRTLDCREPRLTSTMLSRVRRALFAFFVLTLLLAGCGNTKGEERARGGHDDAGGGGAAPVAHLPLAARPQAAAGADPDRGAQHRTRATSSSHRRWSSPRPGR